MSVPIRILCVIPILFLIAVLNGCSHQATTIGVNNDAKQPIKSMDYFLIQGAAPQTGVREALNNFLIQGVVPQTGASQALNKEGFYESAFRERFKQTTEQALAANGIVATVSSTQSLSTVLPSQPFYMVVVPKTVAYNASRQSIVSMTVRATLFRVGSTQPIWDGEHFINGLQSQGIGNFNLGILNALHRAEIVNLKNGHAISPGGHRNHINER